MTRTYHGRRACQAPQRSFVARSTACCTGTSSRGPGRCGSGHSSSWTWRQRNWGSQGASWTGLLRCAAPWNVWFGMPGQVQLHHTLAFHEHSPLHKGMRVCDSAMANAHGALHCTLSNAIALLRMPLPSRTPPCHSASSLQDACVEHVARLPCVHT
jgi:hypothetical protein